MRKQADGKHRDLRVFRTSACTAHAERYSIERREDTLAVVESFYGAMDRGVWILPRVTLMSTLHPTIPVLPRRPRSNASSATRWFSSAFSACFKAKGLCPLPDTQSQMRQALSMHKLFAVVGRVRLSSPA